MNSQKAVQQDYVFERGSTLPTGSLKLTVLRGDAWIFTEGCNFILHTGEQRTISTETNPPVIRRAYTRGFANYQVEVVS